MEGDRTGEHSKAEQVLVLFWGWWEREDMAFLHHLVHVSPKLNEQFNTQ